MSKNSRHTSHCNILAWQRAIPSSTQYGFSLIEMAVVMIILAMLLGGLVAPLTAQIDQRNMNETRQSLAEIKEALIGFAVTSGRLPCPAISAANGDEKVTCVVLGATKPPINIARIIITTAISIKLNPYWFTNEQEF